MVHLRWTVLFLASAGAGVTAKALADHSTNGLPPRVNMEVLGYYENWSAGWVRWGSILPLAPF